MEVIMKGIACTMFISCVTLSLYAGDNKIKDSTKNINKNIILNIKGKNTSPKGLTSETKLALNLFMQNEFSDSSDASAKEVVDNLNKKVSKAFMTNLKTAQCQKTFRELANSVQQLSVSSSSSSGGSSIDQKNNDDISSELVAYSHAVYSLLLKKEMESRDDKKRSEDELRRQRCHMRWGYAIGLTGTACGIIGSILGIIAMAS